MNVGDADSNVKIAEFDDDVASHLSQLYISTASAATYQGNGNEICMI